MTSPRRRCKARIAALRYQAPNAPSMVCMAPVTNDASGPASHATIPATSSGRPWRLMAIKLCISSFIGPFSGLASVSIGPGWTTLTVMPRGQNPAPGRASPCRADLLTA